VEELRQPTTTFNVDLAAAARAIDAFLRALGHAPEHDPLLAETGKLVAAAFHDDLLAGYREDPARLFDDSMPSSSSDLIVVRGLDVTCVCPHHLLPSIGQLHVGYVPAGKLAGLGSIARLASCYARRLVLQETLCEQVANALVEHLGAAAAGCIAELAPGCLTCRGERQVHARVLSLATAGKMQADAALRREFLELAGVRMEQSR
jgi:GTP cyclohydrolase IA